MSLGVPLKGQICSILTALEKYDEMCGAELMTVIDKLPRGTVYRTLKKLEKELWVISRVEKVPYARTRPQRFYRLTTLGRNIVSLHNMYIEQLKKTPV